MSTSDLNLPTSRSASRTPSRRSSFYEPSSGIEINSENTENRNIKTLVGEETEDQKTICNWWTTSYGQKNKEYHEAYSKEILRQIRAQNSPNLNRPAVPAWVG